MRRDKRRHPDARKGDMKRKSKMQTVMEGPSIPPY
jgi:hypothetical protein